MKRRSLFTAVLVLLVAAVAVAMAGGAGASSTRASGAAAPNGVAPSGAVSAESTTLASLADAPNITGPGAPANAFINRPGIPLGKYLAAKAAAAGAKSGVKAAPQPLSTNTLQGHAPLSGQCAAGEACYFPPDINGAVGTTQVVTVTNSHISVYSKSPSSPTLLGQKTLNSLVGYSAGDLFDPRIEYDQLWHRWVFVSDAFPESGGAQRLFIAISSTNDATGGWIVYAPALGDASNFVDYPQVGLSQDAVVVTYNDFTSGPQYVLTFAVAKAILYNASGFSVPLFTLTSSGGTSTPPDVIDQSPRVHELLEQPGASVYNVFFQNPANGAYGSIMSITAISGALTAVPPSAPQPGSCSATSCLIDTSDARFVNDPTQYGNELWAVNTVGAGGFPIPHWYDFWAEGASKNTVKQGNYAFVSGSSYDWNASIVSLAGGRAMMTWSWDDPGGTNPSMAMTGRLATDPVNTMNGATNVVTSAHNLQGNYDSNFGTQRWGDTSSIRYDPGTARTFGFNETVNSTGTAWGTHQGVMSLS